LKKVVEKFAISKIVRTFAIEITTRDGAEAARQAHNLEVVGSNPAPATTTRDEYQRSSLVLFF
jgi:hypothetical protein